MCHEMGKYEPDDSTTPPIGPFGRETLRYGDASDPSTHTSATIRYYADTFTFGDAKLENQTFGVLIESDGIAQGILGLAPDTRGGFDNDDPYRLLLTSMAVEGLINSRVYSLDLRHSEADEGAVIYGGIDRNKYIGNLEKRPIVRGEGGEYRLAVELSSIGMTTEGEEHEFDLDDADKNVILDSGSTLSRLHFEAAKPILEMLDVQDNGEGFYITDCDNRDRDATADFGFGNKIVRVPLSDLIIEMGYAQCYVGIVVTTNQQILGDSVLRAGYFVFDWDNEEVHIAQAANCGDEDIVVVGSGKDAVPNEKGKCKEGDAFTTGHVSFSIPQQDQLLLTRPLGNRHQISYKDRPRYISLHHHLHRHIMPRVRARLSNRRGNNTDSRTPANRHRYGGSQLRQQRRRRLSRLATHAPRLDIRSAWWFRPWRQPAIVYIHDWGGDTFA